MIDQHHARVIFGLFFCLYGPVDARPPNVIVIITDDQGYGDFGLHGNPEIKTPHLDRFAKESMHLRNFYVCPVCAPTRASLLTGRHYYRTGVVDTFLGRAMMHADEATLAEMLRDAGYSTGIFGKWHLGDNYPLRAMDQGFGESLVLNGGGLMQPGDPPGGSKYFNPKLRANGQWVQKTGYCSDVFTDAALDFIDRNRKQPFFTYLAFNAPHEPLEVPDEYRRRITRYRIDAFPKAGHPIDGAIDFQKALRVYAMIANIDDNLGRVFAKLAEWDLARDTIVMFLTDNGPQHPRYNAGLRGRKGMVYDGGIRVPCYIRWPGRLPAERREDPAAHIDVVPTLLEACGVAKPLNVKLDGISLWPWMLGQQPTLPKRTLFVQYHRGEVPELNRVFAAIGPRWKLVQPVGGGAAAAPLTQPRFELYDLVADPFEQRNVATQHPDLVAGMRREYEAWFHDVAATRGFAPPRIVLGSPYENPTVLSRQDFRGPRAGWGPKDRGHWEVEFAESGRYQFTVHARPKSRRAFVSVGSTRLEAQCKSESPSAVALGTATIAKGPARLDAWTLTDADEGDEGNDVGVDYVEVRRLLD